MKKLLLFLLLTIFSYSLIGQTGVGWQQIRQKYNYRDSVNFAKQFKVGGTTVRSSAQELNILDSALVMAFELNRLVGILSPVQTQLNSKLNITDSAVMLSVYLRKADSTLASLGYFSKHRGNIVETDLANTSTIPAATTAGNIMTADGTNWISAAPSISGGTVSGDNTLLYTYNVVVGNSGAPANNDTAWTQTNFVENRIQVFRAGYRQFRNPTNTFPQATNGYSFDKAPGKLYFEPPLSTGEKLIIDVYDSTAVTDVDPPPPGSSSTLLDSLKTYYRLEQNTGTALVDTTGNQNLVTDATDLSVAGKIGRAIHMGRGKELSGYIYNAATVLNWDNWTVKTWVKLDSLPGGAGGTGRTYTLWTSTETAAPYYNALFRMGTDNKLQITVRNSSLSTMASYGGTLATGIWYQLVVRFRGNGYATQIYVGNANTGTFAETTEVGAEIFSGTLYQTHQGMFWGGDDANDITKWTSGAFDEPATWGRALTDGEMLESFTKENAGTGYPY